MLGTLLVLSYYLYYHFSYLGLELLYSHRHQRLFLLLSCHMLDCFVLNYRIDLEPSQFQDL
jgi:hypothetical protein